ncbi:MAG: HAMP domain-containing histidine kinase, partial [Akkermansiaceae bacterium]|nr:HAMP domain-containing histidine kinase [Verrucomicrobiales bacterium]
GAIIFWFGAFISILILFSELGANMGRKDAHKTAEERRRSFIRRLDHEVKNPLTGLRAALANLSEAASPQEREYAAVNARRDVARLTSLLADLRKLSDLDERPLERLPVYAPNILEEIVDAALSLPVYEGRIINLLITNVPPLPLVTGDRDLLGLAFYNLVENALKYSGAEKEVEVRAREDGRSILIEVADGGSGIAPEDLPHLCEELYRGANARGIDGSGLGLALTARIVDLHGGTLNVTSRQGERQGTMFSIMLPARRGS